MRVFFAYDNEDWCAPLSDDIVKQLAEIHERHGITASFYTVAERARVLRLRGRKDVIDALSRHEIAYHGDTHGHFPQPLALYCEKLGWEAGLAELLRIEGRGVRDVAEIFGKFPVTWCQGECNWSPQAVYGLRLLGIGSWTGSLYGTPDGMPVWYMGQLCVRRAMHTVSIQLTSAGEELLRRFQRDFERLMEEKEGRGFIYVFGHPCRWGSDCWYGQDQWSDFRSGRITRPSHLQPPTRQYSCDEIERLLHQTDLCIEWVLSHHDLQPTTYAELNAACREPTMQWLTTGTLIQAVAQVGETFNYVTTDKTTLSPADLLAAAVWTLTRTRRDGSLPDAIPVRRPLGPLVQPLDADTPASLPKSVVLTACSAVDAEIEKTGAIPARITVGQADLGPADVLRLSAAVLQDPTRNRFALVPGPTLPEIADARCFRETRVNSWSLPEGFEPRRLFDLARWQSWTFRPAIMRW